VLAFRLDLLDLVEDAGGELLLRFEERDGRAGAPRAAATGLEIGLVPLA
jgi:hypothetical protein